MITGSEEIMFGGGECSSSTASSKFQLLTLPGEEFGLSLDNREQTLSLFVILSKKKDEASYRRLYQEWNKLQAKGIKLERTERLVMKELAKAGISRVTHKATLESLLALLGAFLETDPVLRASQFKLHEFLQRISQQFESIKVLVQPPKQVNEAKELTEEKSTTPGPNVETEQKMKKGQKVKGGEVEKGRPNQKVKAGQKTKGKLDQMSPNDKNQKSTSSNETSIPTTVLAESTSQGQAIDVANSFNKVIRETEEFLKNSDALLQADFPNIEEFLINKTNESKRYFKSKSKSFKKEMSKSNINLKFLMDQERDLTKFLLKRNQSLVEEARRTCPTQSRDKADMKDSERFILGLWLAEDIADVKEKYKGSYALVPWEEAEFLLIGHLAVMKRLDSEISPYSLFLYPQRVSEHLGHFRQLLVTLYEDNQLEPSKGYPGTSRDQTIADILQACPQLGPLYRDYKLLRDIYSLQRSCFYLSAALHNISNDIYCQLAVEKAIQVIGECVKNSHMSPNMSEEALKLTYMFSNEVIRKCVTGLRDFLSHKHHKVQECQFKDVRTCLSKIWFLFSTALHLRLIQAFQYFAEDIKRKSTDFFLLQNVLRKVQCYQLECLLKEYDVTEFFKLLADNYNDNDLEESSQKLANKMVENINGVIINFLCFITEICAMKEDTKSTIPDRVNLMERNLSIILVKYIQDQGFNAYINLTNIKNSTPDRIKLQKLQYQLKDNELPTENLQIYSVLNVQKSGDGDPNKEKLKSIHKEIAHTPEVEQTITETLQKELEKMPIITTKRETLIKDIIQTIVLKGKETQLLHINFDPDYNMHEFETILDDLTKSPTKSSIVEMMILKIKESENSPEGSVQRVGAYSRFLHGKQLRNYLAHGDRMDLIDPMERLCILAHAAIEYKYGDNTSESIEVDCKRGEYLEIVLKNEAMLQAVLEEDLSTVREMVPQINESKWLSIKGCDFSGKGVWHMAIRRNDVAFMQQLQKDFSLVLPREIESLILIAVINDSEKILEYLFDVKSSQKMKDEALFTAIDRGHHRTVETMLNIGADPNAINNIGSTPLIEASYRGHHEIVKELLRSDRSIEVEVNHVDHKGKGALHMAAVRGHHEIILELIKNKAKVDLSGSDRRTPLHNASQKGFLEAVEVLLEVGNAGVNLEMDSGYTALHLAAEEGHKAVVECLLKNGANVNSQSHKGKTALHYACRKGHYDVATVLIEKNASLDLMDVKDKTVLHCAALSGNVELFEYLLSQTDSLIESTDFIGETPLHVAAEAGQREIVDSLIKSKANIEAEDNYGHRPLHLAVKEGHKDIVKALIEEKADIEAILLETGWTPLIIASLEGHLEIVKILLDNGAKIDKEGKNGELAIHAAICNGHCDIATILYPKPIKKVTETKNQVTGNKSNDMTKNKKNGKEDKYIKNKGKEKKNDKNKNKANTKENKKDKDNEKKQQQEKVNEELPTGSQGVTPLMLAAQYGNYSLCKKFLENGADPNIYQEDGFTAIHTAAEQGNTQLIELLIKFNANVNLKTKDGRTSLFFAVQEGHRNAAKILLDNDARLLNIPRNDGNYPIHIAASNGHLDALKLLIERGASVNCQSQEKLFTPLFLACSKQNKYMVKYMLDQNADVNITNCDNIAPIHTAVMTNNLEILELLIKKSASVNITSKGNITPLSFACYCNFTEIAKRLLKVDSIDVNIPAAVEPFEPTPLRQAVISGELEIVQLLIERGANIDDETLAIAISLDNKPIISSITKAREGN